MEDAAGGDAAYHQIFWSGHKDFFGEQLPYGKYLCVLSATDITGRDTVLRKTITLAGGTAVAAAPVVASKKAAAVSGVSSVTLGKKGRKAAKAAKAAAVDSQDGTDAATAPAAKTAQTSSNTFAMPYKKGTLIFAEGGRQSLEKLAAALGANPDSKATITGYAGSGEPKAKALAQKRAAAVVYILINEHSIDKSRLTTAIKVSGKAKPFAVAVMGE